MRFNYRYIINPLSIIVLFASCSSLEKASSHGLNSGYYKDKSKRKDLQNVYLDITDEKIDVYHCKKRQPDKRHFLTIPLKANDSLKFNSMVFKKQSLDIDITAILLKYRPSVNGFPAQMTTDFNIALYAGWRHDNYFIVNKKDPLTKSYQKINNRGYDFGFFAGLGSSPISPFTTQNNRTDEYNGMIIQTGFTGFIESNIASFGFAIGYDYLLSSDRQVWIYNNKLWMGFIVGVALN